jgi:hypothetical protein
MTKKQNKSTTPKASLDDPSIVLFQDEKVVPKAGAVELHLFGSTHLERSSGVRWTM